MTKSSSLEFWFEFASTYSYPAAARLCDVARAAKIEIVWRPFLLGPIFAAQGWNDSPFNLQPVKGRYMWRDLERLCEGYGLPFRQPTRFPRNGLLAARIATAAEQAGESWLADYVRSVYAANFAEDRDIADLEVQRDLLHAVGAPVEPTLERAASSETKQLLRERTDAAGERGVFGAPSFVVGDELFWGQDRLGDAVAWCLTMGR